MDMRYNVASQGPLFLSDEDPSLKTLDFTFYILAVPQYTNLLDLYLYSNTACPCSTQRNLEKLAKKEFCDRTRPLVRLQN